MAQLVAHLTGSRQFESKLGHISFVNIDHELISAVILPTTYVFKEKE